MSNKYQNSNLVVKNGVYLAARMLLVLFLAFFTTRISLQVLGDEKFGIYNIVGGVIAIFAIISMPIRDSLQRFLNVEAAKDESNSNVVFSTSVRIVRLMILVIVVLYETIGLFVINYVIKYPEDEHFTINVIFQMTVISNILSFSYLPYLSFLFSKENMRIPAICEIVASVFKLVLLLLIPYIPVNVLIPYTGIFLLTNTILYIFYRKYCEKKYAECNLTGKYSKSLQKRMLSFSRWSVIEAVAGITITYVSNILVNVFGGILYNTAYGISKQLQDAVVSFSLNVLKASDPQIMSNTATNNNNYRDQLILTTMKVSFLGVAFVSIVFHYDCPFLLSIWLKEIPNYVIEFSKVALITVVFTSIGLPLRTLIMATGRIKAYFLAYGFDSVFIILTMFILLKLGFPVIAVMYLILTSSVIMFIVGVIIVSRISSICVSRILSNLVPSLVVVGIVAIVYFITYKFFVLDNIIIRFIISFVLSLCTLISASYLIALNKAEKDKVKHMIVRLFNR